MKKAFLPLTLAAAFALSGCSAMSTAIKHHELNVDSKMSESIFLDPVPKRKKTIFVQVRNTTSHDLPALKEALSAELVKEGWRIVDDPEQAHKMVQMNVLQAGEAEDPQTVWTSMSSGYGSSIALGSLAGLAVGYRNDNVSNGLGAGLLVGAGSWVADQLVKNTTYSVITDVQVSSRTDKAVKQITQAKLDQGKTTQTHQSYEQETNWLRYRTRVASMANQMNLNFNDAKPVLTQQLATEVAGIFGT